MATRFLVAEPLHVNDALVGAALASPMRRMVAFTLDLLLLIVPTLAAAIMAAALSLQARDPRAFQAVRTLVSAPRAATAARHEAVCDLAPTLVRTEARGVPAAVAAAVEEGNRRKACELLDGYDISFSLKFEDTQEGELAGKRVVLPVQKVISPAFRALALLGVPALYFVIFTRSRRGATVGKRVCGIRVARLDGERLSWLEALERFVGYVHIPATMFITVADLWRDPNRRLPHDRTVHTAVFRVRRRQPFPPAGARSTT